MHATSTPTPPSTPEPGAAWLEFRHVRVTRVTEDSKTSPQADVDVFTQYLVFLDLNRQQNYDFYEALELLAKDQADLLQPFEKCHTDSFKTLSERKTSIKTLHDLELQMISLIRLLFELSGGIVECRQHTLDQEYTISDNLNLYMILVGVTDTNRFEKFDSNEMYSALLKSKVFEDSDIGTLNTIEWSMRMMEFLSIGFPEGYLIIYYEHRA
ncbi:MAG: hypothetical protein Q9191_000226 [Dirinaria sp. TL-2023a]